MLLDHQIDLEEFERQTLPHQNDLRKTAGKVVRDINQVEDIVQETYLQAWKSFHRFEPGTNCRAWLFAILFHIIHHHWRRLSLMKTIWQNENMSKDMPVYEPPQRDEITDESVLAALDNVPKQFRDVLLLSDVQELTYKEISSALQIPIGTVMSRLNRARNLLRNALLPLARDRRMIPPDELQLSNASL